jgi:ATP diphosphatase
VFHSEIAREQGRFTAADVVREIHDKMVRRHPHVFGKVRAKDSAQVLKHWERIKAEERQQKAALHQGTAAADGTSENADTPDSILAGVSRGLPAMLEGLQLTRKAARVGFDWHNADGIFEKLREEMAEVRHALSEKNAAKAEEELGDLLFAAVNLARFVHVDPEIALKKANAKFQRRFADMEKAAQNQHKRSFAELPREQMESLWDAVKHQENKTAETTALASLKNGNATSSSSNAKTLNSRSMASPTR